MPAHDTQHHPICGTCWDERHPDEEPDVAVGPDAVKCCFCNKRYTRTGIVDAAPADQLPLHIEAAEQVARQLAELAGEEQAT